MNPLLISDYGVSIHTHFQELEIKTKTGVTRFKPREFPHDHIILDTHFANISANATLWLAKHGVDVLHSTWNSVPYAHTIPLLPQNIGALKINQVKAFIDENVRLAIAKSIICSRSERTFRDG
jgi:CRISPR/Cas system-associated endonuclease Cas1